MVDFAILSISRPLLRGLGAFGVGGCGWRWIRVTPARSIRKVELDAGKIQNSEKGDATLFRDCIDESQKVSSCGDCTAVAGQPFSI